LKQALELMKNICRAGNAGSISKDFPGNAC
jgi:hypothetical protein